MFIIHKSNCFFYEVKLLNKLHKDVRSFEAIKDYIYFELKWRHMFFFFSEGLRFLQIFKQHMFVQCVIALYTY